jgi:hypothetical protein
MTFDFRKFLREIPDWPEATALVGAVKEASASGEELRQPLAVLAESAGQALPQIQEGWAALSESFRQLPRGEELRQQLAVLAESAGQASRQFQVGWAAFSESFWPGFERLRQALDDLGTVELVVDVSNLVLHQEFRPELPLNEAESQRFNEDMRELFRELEERKRYWLACDDLPFPERRRRCFDDLRVRIERDAQYEGWGAAASTSKVGDISFRPWDKEKSLQFRESVSTQPELLQLAFEDATGDVIIRDVTRLSRADARLIRVLKDFYCEDLACQRAPQNHQYVRSENLANLLNYQDVVTVRQLVSRCRKTVKEAIDAINNGKFPADGLIQTRRPNGYRLNPLIRIIAVTEIDPSPTASRNMPKHVTKKNSLN